MKLFAVLACLSVAVHGAKFSNSGFTVQAGSTFDIKWIDASGPVSIELRNGNPADLQHVIVVANGRPTVPRRERKGEKKKGGLCSIAYAK